MSNSTDMGDVLSMLIIFTFARCREPGRGLAPPVPYDEIIGEAVQGTGGACPRPGSPIIGGTYFHLSITCKLSCTIWSSGASATYSSVECSFTTPFDTVNVLMRGRKALVSLPIKVGCSSRLSPRRARVSR